MGVVKGFWGRLLLPASVSSTCHSPPSAPLSPLSLFWCHGIGGQEEVEPDQGRPLEGGRGGSHGAGVELLNPNPKPLVHVALSGRQTPADLQGYLTNDAWPSSRWRRLCIVSPAIATTSLSTLSFSFSGLAENKVVKGFWGRPLLLTGIASGHHSPPPPPSSPLSLFWCHSIRGQEMHAAECHEKGDQTRGVTKKVKSAMHATL
ncbi:hypothetical protein Cgig2_021644 [Carnegiea gigantea]|uniref:Uncharacterized protein n=1 Tax=Carnegiea gigantea TaxID=171969 RepID=A0A9Q1QB61_9CARY|nr:hypothetical protein Cgig2_021644 [Carnegiea gigantea]